MNVSVTGVGVGNRCKPDFISRLPNRASPLQMDRNAHHSAALEMRQHDG
jgi:hypothetical protein